MKNNKGFTMLELIATIGIMALIGIVIANNMTGILSKQNDQEYEEFKKELEDSACTYVETKWDTEKRNTCKSNNNCTISIEELVNSGLISDTLKNPNTGEKVIDNQNKYVVSIQWIENVKTCKVKE